MALLIEFLKESRRQGRDIQVDPILMGATGEEIFHCSQDGTIVLSSQVLEMEILFIKADAGKGFFGGQKVRFVTYLKSQYEADWLQGHTFKTWPFAVTSIGNIYRGVGLR